MRHAKLQGVRGSQLREFSAIQGWEHMEVRYNAVLDINYGFAS